MMYAVDLDGTLTKGWVPPEKYLQAEPDEEAIRKINALHAKGHHIIIYTARWHQDWNVTYDWLEHHEVKFHVLIMGKLRADCYIDNASMRIEEVEV